MAGKRTKGGGAPKSPGPDDLFVGGGEMGALMRATDWSKTRLGPAERWPKSLRTMLGVVLGSRYPMLLWWGPDLLHLYNDAYRPILRDKHPASLAAPAAEVWAEVWDVAGPMARGVQQGGPATWTEDLQLFIASGKMAEETYFTFSYSPVPGDDGRVGGVLNTVQETTSKVRGERQIRMLHELSERAAGARSKEEAYRAALEVLSANELDLPFVLLYDCDGQAAEARLVGAGGWQDYDGTAKPARLPIAPKADARAWPLGDLLRGAPDLLVDDLAGRFGALPAGRWGAVPEQAMVMPLSRAGQKAPYAFLVAGVSPHRALDDRYLRFFRATADQVSTVIANARAHEEQKQRAEALAEIDRAKTAFFSNVSHEFRTPLTLILGPTEDALASPGRALSGEALEMVRRNTLRLMKLVNALLDFSRIESGRMRASYEPSDGAAMTAYLASAFRSAIERAGLRFEVDCEPLPEPLWVDHDMWEKIVLNLLSNALKFTFEGSIGIRLSWCGDRAELSVRDTGTGIPESELPHLFERFHRVLGARSRTHEGSGIGLALVHELVALHGGTVAVASEVDAGTTFTVSIPRGSGHLPAERVAAKANGAWAPRGAAAFVEEAERWSGGAKPDAPWPSAAPARGVQGDVCILVVDDNADLRDYMVSLLGGSYRVETAVDGVAGLEAARLHKPALVLSDVMMPRLDGFGLLRALRADPALHETPVILLSARAGEESTVEGLAAGADDYLVKPFGARELLARVKTHVELSLGRREGQLRRIQEQLAQAQKMEAIGMLAGGVAHDFNNLLSVILTYTELVMRGLDQGNPAWEDLREVKQAGERAAGLTRQLLAFSRKQALEPKIVDLNDLMLNSVKMLHRLIGEDIELTATPTPGLGAIRVDPGQMEQVLLNLTVNARDAMPRGGKLTLETANVDLSEDYVREHFGVLPGPYVMLAVSDTGHGMDKATQARIFEPFFTTKGAGKGTGLGLATVFGIVRQSQGHIWVYSEPGKGTTFKVYFPRCGEAAAGAEAVPGEITELSGTETILLVEDDEQLRKLGCSLLRGFGYRILEARNAGEALLIAEKHPDAIHLLLTDVVMPFMSGTELAKRLGAVRSELRVLCMSGYTDEAILSHGIMEAGLPYIQKPVTPEKLARKIREVLAAGQ